MDDIMNFLSDSENNYDDVELSSADESAIFLAALQDSCTPEEYEQLVLENATELELYGLIENAEMVKEAMTVVKHKITKQENLKREQSKAALRIAKRKNTPEYRKYKFHKQKMREYRDKIYAKTASNAKKEAKNVVMNAKRKASSMNTVTGKTITEKMDKKIKEMEKSK